MAGHGSAKHLKRMASGKFAGLHRKGSIFVEKPLPGPHSKKLSIPLSTLIKDSLKLADSSKQSHHLVSSGGVLVDGRKVKESKMPIGLADLVSVPVLGKTFAVGVSKGVIKLFESKNGGVKYCRVTGKKLAGKNKIQLGLHDGRVVLTADKAIKVGDSVKITVPKQEIKQVLKLEKGAKCLIYLGRHSGIVGSLEEILPGKDVRLKSGGEDFITRKDYLFVIDDSAGFFD
jgi:small subunit ribosomal protein S4e